MLSGQLVALRYGSLFSLDRFTTWVHRISLQTFHSFLELFFPLIFRWSEIVVSKKPLLITFEKPINAGSCVLTGK